jgi:DNA polymerase-3 subunit delta
MWCPEDGVLLSGDHVLPTITPHIGGFIGGDPLANYLANLDKVAELEGITRVLPAHGHPFDDLAARCNAIKDHHATRLQMLADAADQVMVALRAGVQDLPDDTWVVALHSGERNKRALEELRTLQVPGGLVEVPCAKVKAGRPTRELLEQEARRAGRRITSDGVDALVMALGSDIALLVGALEQLFADSAEDPIDAAEVTATFAGVAEVSGFQLADAVWEGRALLALQRLRWGLVSQTISGAGAVGSLAAGLRAMVKVAGTPRGMSEADVARLAGVPPFKVRVLRSAAASWEPAQLAEAVKQLAAVDAQMKGGLRPGESLEPAQKVRALEAFVLDTVGLQERPVSRGRGAPGVH